MRPQVFIEAWSDPFENKKWIAEVRDERDLKEYNNPASWYQSPFWDYKFVFRGRKATVTFVSKEVFTRDEALAISLLIVEGKGVKAWRIDLE